MRQECKKKEEYGDLKAYEASQEPNNSSLSKILIKSHHMGFREITDVWDLIT